MVSIPATGEAQPARDRLSPRERSFVLEYLANGQNGTQAYRAVHPAVNAASAATMAWRLLRNVEIQHAIAAALADRWKRLEMRADESVALISLRARADIGEAFGPDGTMLPVHQWPDSIRLAVKSIRPGPFGDTITLHDGLKAAELMAMIQGRLRSGLDVNLNFDHVGHLAAIEKRRLEALKKTGTR